MVAVTISQLSLSIFRMSRLLAQALSPMLKIFCLHFCINVRLGFQVWWKSNSNIKT